MMNPVRYVLTEIKHSGIFQGEAARNSRITPIRINPGK
jgi:hypothetical protein